MGLLQQFQLCDGYRALPLPKKSKISVTKNPDLIVVAGARSLVSLNLTFYISNT
jgi:hypothetical protein